MTEVAFHWSMVAYYAYVDITSIKALVNAHSLRGRDPDDPTTNRMIYGVLSYITIWNMAVQQLYFAMCCREHLLLRASGGEKRNETYRKARQVLLRSILFPTTFVVSTLYWFHYWKSPKLIFGDILSEIYPRWVDHSMHTFIVPIALIELYFSATRERLLDSGKMKGWLTLNAFLTTYTATVIIARLIRGVWPYPFLDPVNNGSPLAFLLFLYLSGGFWCCVEQYLSHNVWGSRYEGRKRKSQF